MPLQGETLGLDYPTIPKDHQECRQSRTQAQIRFATDSATVQPIQSQYIRRQSREAAFPFLSLSKPFPPSRKKSPVNSKCCAIEQAASFKVSHYPKRLVLLLRGRPQTSCQR